MPSNSWFVVGIIGALTVFLNTGSSPIPFIDRPLDIVFGITLLALGIWELFL